MSNPVIDVIKQRSSIRAYKQEPLTKEQTDTLIAAALASPSARNMQPWSINVLQNRELIIEWEKAIVDYFFEKGDQVVMEMLKSRNCKIFYDAPCVIVIPINQQNNYAKIDAGILVQNVALAAKSLGLDSVILGFPGFVFTGEKAEEWKRKLLFPAGYDFGISIAVGYADTHKDPHPPEPSKVVHIP